MKIIALQLKKSGEDIDTIKGADLEISLADEGEKEVLSCNKETKINT